MFPTGVLFTEMSASSTESTTVFWRVFCCGWLGGGGWGRAMSRPFWASGVTTMKMMRSTSITSMRGVMLMSEVAARVAGRVASWEWTTDFFLWSTGLGASATANPAPSARR